MRSQIFGKGGLPARLMAGFCFACACLPLLAQPCTNTFIAQGAIGSGDPVQDGRLVRDGDPGTCEFPKLCPGEFDLVSRRYDAYCFTNWSSDTVCVAVELVTTCGSDRLFSAAYFHELVPTDVCVNYLADGGYSGLTNVYSFEAPAGAIFMVVVHEKDAGAGCNNYTLTVMGDLAAIPSLAIARATNRHTLVWATGCNDFVLESTAQFATPAWTAITNSISQNASNSFVTLTNAAGGRYYRLRKRGS